MSQEIDFVAIWNLAKLSKTKPKKIKHPVRPTLIEGQKRLFKAPAVLTGDEDRRRRAYEYNKRMAEKYNV